MLQDSAILVSLHLAKLSARKTDEATTVETIARKGATGDAGKWQTNLFPAGSLEPIAKLDGEIRRFHYEKTLPWADDGNRLLPSRMFQVYSAEMRRFASDRQSRVLDFQQKWPSIVADAQVQLGSLFCPSNYPNQSTVIDKFKFRWDTSPVPGRGDFRIDVPAKEMEAMERSLAEKIEAAETIARNDLVGRITAPLGKIVDRLSDPDGRFRDSLIENLRQIAGSIDVLNITGDSRLAEIAAALNSADSIIHADPKALRSDPTYRSVVLRTAESYLGQLNEVFPQ